MSMMTPGGPNQPFGLGIPAPISATETEFRIWPNPSNGDLFLAAGDPFIPETSGDPFIPETSGDPFIPETSGDPITPETAGEQNSPGKDAKMIP